MGAISTFLKSVLDGINSVIGSYGWSVMVFTLLVRLILFPFDYKSRVSMRKTAAIQPKMAELQKKYGKDQEKLQRKMSELYKKEHVSPLSGCWPMLLTYPILIAMWSAMRSIANEQIVGQILQMLQDTSGTSELPAFEGWLWIRNIWMPDTPFASVLPDLKTLNQISGEVWTKLFTPEVIATLPGELSQFTESSFAKASLQATVQQVYDALKALPVYQAHGGAVPGWTFNFLIFNVSLMKEYNGLLLLPILSAVSQFVMTKLTPATQQPTPNDQAPQQNSMKFLNYFFPIFSLWICLTYNGAFSLYWVTSNLIALVQTVCINKYLDMKDKKHQAETVEGTVI